MKISPQEARLMLDDLSINMILAADLFDRGYVSIDSATEEMRFFATKLRNIASNLPSFITNDNE